MYAVTGASGRIGRLRETGMPYAFLRNGWYLENYLIGAKETIEHGVLLGSTGAGRISAASRADYAAAAIAVLTSDEPRHGIYEFAGNEAFTLADVAAALSEVSGKPVEYHYLSEQAYRDALVGAGVPSGSPPHWQNIARGQAAAFWRTTPARSALSLAGRLKPCATW